MNWQQMIHLLSADPVVVCAYFVIWDKFAFSFLNFYGPIINTNVNFIDGYFLSSLYQGNDQKMIISVSN